MKYFVYLLAIIILLGLNLGIFNFFPVSGQIPNLLFLLTLFFALEKKDYDFFFVAFVCGLFLDFYSAGFFGAFTLAFLAVSVAANLFVNNVFVFEINWKTLSPALLAGLFFFSLLVWAYGLLAFKLSWGSQYVNIGVFISNFPVNFLYNWFLLYPVYLFFTFLRGLVDNLSSRRRGVVR